MRRDFSMVLKFYWSFYYKYQRALPLLFGEIRYGEFYISVDSDFQDAVIDDVIEATR